MRENTKAWLMLLPAMIIIVVLFIGGFFYGLIQSLNYMPMLGLYEFNFNAYSAVLGDPKFIQSMLYTFYIAFGSTILSIIVAIVVSMAIRKHFKAKRATMFAYQFPLPIPHLVSAIMVLFMFSQSGLLARFLTLLGLIGQPADFPELIYSKNGIGIIIALMWKFVPYVGVAVVGILQTSGTEFEEAAISLGANKWQRFIHVLLPVIMPSITTSAILIFAYAFSAYEIPYLLGAAFPKTLSIIAYEKFMNINLMLRPQAMAMSTIITVIVLLITMIYRTLAKKVRY